MQCIFNDGGRVAAGFKGSAGDCVVRAVAIATEQPYQAVYDALAEGNRAERQTNRSTKSSGKRSANNGINVRRKWFKDYMARLGWKWVATMGIGTGCKVHLTDGELPMGRLIVSVSKHYTAVVDGVIHDTHDPQRWSEEYSSGVLSNYAPVGNRCVYGYWVKA